MGIIVATEALVILVVASKRPAVSDNSLITVRTSHLVVTAPKLDRLLTVAHVDYPNAYLH